MKRNQKVFGSRQKILKEFILKQRNGAKDMLISFRLKQKNLKLHKILR